MRGYATDEPGFSVPGDDESFPEQDAIDAEKDVHHALQVIVDHHSEKAVNWAVNYARVGLRLTGRDLRTQVLYVLCNIQHWRGEVAKEVRSVLKSYVGEKR